MIHLNGSAGDAPLIQLNGIYKVYRAGDVPVVALNNIDLEIARGEMLSIIGASGSGKSTLMNILGCLDRPTSGQIFLYGQDVSGLPPYLRPVNTVFQARCSIRDR